MVTILNDRKRTNNISGRGVNAETSLTLEDQTLTVNVRTWATRLLGDHIEHNVVLLDRTGNELWRVGKLLGVDGKLPWLTHDRRAKVVHQLPTEVPVGAEPAGYGDNASPDNPKFIYVARAAHEDGLHPGGLRERGLAADVPYGMRVQPKKEYEIYVGSLNWMEVSGGSIPENAIVGGHEADGTALFVARGHVGEGADARLVVGKVRDGLRGARLPYAGREVAVADYEVLVAR